MVFHSPDREPKEIEALLLALPVHGAKGHTHLRDRIVGNYRLVLEHYPALAPKVVADLLAWECYDLAGPVAEIASAAAPDTDLVALSRMRHYLSRAE